MRILLAHNAYQQAGGEDVVFRTEKDQLISAGHSVQQIVASNDTITTLADKARVAARAASNPQFHSVLKERISSFRPEILHIHNFFPLLSPSFGELAVRLGVPVVHTLHNYRVICADGQFYRNGRPCEQCLGGSRAAAIIHACYRSSHLASLAVARMGLRFRWFVKNNKSMITLIALTEFQKGKLIADGYDGSRIVVKGNSIDDPGEGPEFRERYVVFVGRLSGEKGVHLLARIAPKLSCPLYIFGSGPDENSLRELNLPHVHVMGSVPQQVARQFISRSSALLVPSQWYEGFPMVIVEAFAAGTPVIVSDLGALPGIVSSGTSGIVCPPDDPCAWIEAVHTLLKDTPGVKNFRHNARRTYLARHSPSHNLDALLSIYDDLITQLKPAIPESALKASSPDTSGLSC
jgi:glycosyltransferase involved in cell wall biosynthesis